MTTQENLFGLALSLAAGLYNRGAHEFNIDRLRSVRVRRADIIEAKRQIFANPKILKFNDLQEVSLMCTATDLRQVFFAVSGYGLLHAAVLALQLMGFKPAFVFRRLDAPAIQSISALGVRLIDARAAKDVIGFFQLLREVQSNGFTLVLRTDAPGESRIRYSFLGYDVQCAKLIEMYAKRTHSTIIPIHAKLNLENKFDVFVGKPLRSAHASMQTLLSDIEADIIADPDNYFWTTDSIVFSDPRAVINGLMCMPAFLRWRKSGRLANFKS
jgi:lauroyl/myristoyl acyltransferase